jgi:hypothetical protein
MRHCALRSSQSRSPTSARSMTRTIPLRMATTRTRVPRSLAKSFSVLPNGTIFALVSYSPIELALGETLLQLSRDARQHCGGRRPDHRVVQGLSASGRAGCCRAGCSLWRRYAGSQMAQAARLLALWRSGDRLCVDWGAAVSGKARAQRVTCACWPPQRWAASAVGQVRFRKPTVPCCHDAASLACSCQAHRGRQGEISLRRRAVGGHRHQHRALDAGRTRRLGRR